MTTTSERKIAYNQAIREGLQQALSMDESVLVMGQLVDYKAGIFGTTTGLVDQFGSYRVQDFPISESAMTMTSIGAAMAGLRPVLCHQRLDFMLNSMDAIGNWMSLWYYKSNHQSTVPLTIRMVVGKGWGQGPQHSKSLHSWFAHIPGVRVCMPATPFDAKGMLLESIFGETPTLIIEGRSLFSMTEHVPQNSYRVRFGKAMVRRTGTQVTLVTLGWMVPQALRVADLLSQQGISVEVIDLRSVRPWDRETVLKSAAKTRSVVVADPGWKSFGISGEIVATICEEIEGVKVKRIALPDCHTPVSQALEKDFYPKDEEFISIILKTL